MKIVALLTVRNESKYIRRCLSHLFLQGVEVCLIDNGSEDDTLRIARAFEGRSMLQLHRLPYDGYFDLTKILQNEERLSREISADWFMHHDADEIREAPRPYRTLAEGFADADRKGYNAVNFDEFVFAPTDDSENHEQSSDYVATMRRYYFFEPRPLRRVNAWKNTGRSANLTLSGGHRIVFEGRRILPASFILRHYIALNSGHLAEKYGNRRFAPGDLKLGWHADRARFHAGSFHLPEQQRLKTLSEKGEWDRSDPWKRHPFFEYP